MGEVEEAPAIFTRKTERVIHGDIPGEDIPGVGEGMQWEHLNSTVRRGRSIVPNSIVRSSSAAVLRFLTCCQLDLEICTFDQIPMIKTLLVEHVELF